MGTVSYKGAVNGCDMAVTFDDAGKDDDELGEVQSCIRVKKGIANTVFYGQWNLNELIFFSA